MDPAAEENARFESNRNASTREEKEEILREFLTSDSIYIDEGVPVNQNKFLYLYGEENTGKLTILKQVAKDVFGDNWESKIYLRIDEGQRYPYKLHAHKVESSRKVIFVTNSRISWGKWKELYPMLRTFTFFGIEHQQTQDGLVTVRYSDYFTENRNRKERFKADILNIFKDACEIMNLPENSLFPLQEKLMDRIRRDWSDQLANFTHSEVRQTTP